MLYFLFPSIVVQFLSGSKKTHRNILRTYIYACHCFDNSEYAFAEIINGNKRRMFPPLGRPLFTSGESAATINSLSEISSCSAFIPPRLQDRLSLAILTTHCSRSSSSSSSLVNVKWVIVCIYHTVLCVVWKKLTSWLFTILLCEEIFLEAASMLGAAQCSIKQPAISTT